MFDSAEVNAPPLQNDATRAITSIDSRTPGFDIMRNDAFSNAKPEMKSVELADSQTNALDRKCNPPKEGIRFTVGADVRMTAKNGDVIDAEAGSKIIAEAGSTVYAQKGSTVDVSKGAVVYAEKGSNITIGDGCSVNAPTGPTIHAEKGLCVKSKPGASIDAYKDSIVISRGFSDIGTTEVTDSILHQTNYIEYVKDRRDAIVNAHEGATVYATSQFSDLGVTCHPSSGPDYDRVGQRAACINNSVVNIMGDCTIYQQPTVKINECTKEARVTLKAWNGVPPAP